MTSRIVIFGATSGIGKCALQEALRRGHTVRAFARGADKLDAREGMEAFAGDALNPADVAAALNGMDAVIYALGVPKDMSVLWKTVTLFSDTTRILLEEMAKTDVKRLLVVTGFGAGRSRAAMSGLESLGHKAVLGKPYADKDVQEDMIMNSDTDWTIARPVILTNSARTGKYQVLREPSKWRNGLISRADTACYLLDALEGDLEIRQDVVIAR